MSSYKTNRKQNIYSLEAAMRVSILFALCESDHCCILWFQIFLENLEHEDAFVYLSAIQGKLVMV